MIRDQEVRAEQVRTLFRQSGPVLTTNVVNALVVVAVLWARGPQHLLLGWFCCILTMTAVRVQVVRRYRRVKPPPSDAGRWGLYFSVGSVVAGILWGTAAFSLFAVSGTLSQLLLTFVVAGMSAAAAGTLSCYLPAFLGFIIPALAPFAMRVAVMGDSVHQTMGLMLGIFGLGLSVVAILTNRSISESFLLRIEKDRLLLQLADSRNHLETMNRTLEERVAERSKALERQTEVMRATQRLETVGRLAGGIAHNFNNLLSAIIFNTTAISNEAEIPGAIRETVNDIHASAERGANLVRQLLLFSRRQPSVPQIVDLNQVVGDMRQLLAGMLGDRLTLTIVPSPTDATIRIDRTRAEQIIVNLVSNARDATPDGGQITIQTDVVEHTTARGRSLPGPYAVLCVSDTGSGMDEETRTRVFDPFFTTKGLGKGTGLGLAAVYGIVEEFAGHIAVDSRPGAGSTFKVYLPYADGAATAV